MNIHHVSGSCTGEVCRMCLPAKVAATHKVGEEISHDDPLQVRHNLTAYVCCTHFREILGPAVPCPQEDEITEPVTPEVLQDLLGLVLPRVPTTRVIAEWTAAQQEEASMWASACHLSASDNDDVVVPPQPEFLKKYNAPPVGVDNGIWPVRQEVDE